MKRRALTAGMAFLLCGTLSGCDQDRDGGARAIADAPALGPVDGEDLPPTDLDRVGVGSPAPDFTLASYSGDPVTLSDYRGQKVLLVFYRGHW